jgi:hypothetical protein
MLQASVGRGGENRPDDVRLVQTWLNRWRFLDGRRPLPLDGKCSPSVIAGIRQFEGQAMGRKYPCDRVTANCQTVRLLENLPAWSDGEADAHRADKS